MGNPLTNLFEILGSSFVFIALALAAIWECATASFLWTFIPRNHIILFDRGVGNPAKVLGVNRRLSHDFLGIFWVGLPPIEVHKFPFLHERVNPEMTADTESQDWIKRESDPILTDHLLEQVMHWVRVPGVEFKGGQRADILFQYSATVAGEKGALVAVYDREGKFFDTISSLVNNAAIGACRNMTYEDFREIRKDVESDFCVNNILSVVKATSPDLSGYKLDTIFVYRYDASSKVEEKLARSKMAAKIRLSVAKLDAKAGAADIDEMAKAIKRHLPNATHDEIVRLIAELGKYDRIAKTKLVATGGSAMVDVMTDTTGSSKRKGGKNK